MTAQQVAAIVGVTVHDYERRMLAAADESAATFLAAGQGAMLSGESGHFAAFHDIHVAVDGATDVAELSALLSAWDDARARHARRERSVRGPSDAACNRYTPQLGAAYYFGLALGLRLAGGGR